MIRFRSLYSGKNSGETIDLPCRISKLSCGLISEFKERDEDDQFKKTKDLHKALEESVSRRHMPQYSISFTTSRAMGVDPTIGLRQLTKFRGYERDSATRPEIEVSPVAVFHGRLDGSRMQWTLIAAGMIQSLTISHSFDVLDGTLAEVDLTVMDLRLETDFLQSVDIRKMNPDWQRTTKIEEQPEPNTKSSSVEIKVSPNRKGS